MASSLFRPPLVLVSRDAYLPPSDAQTKQVVAALAAVDVGGVVVVPFPADLYQLVGGKWDRVGGAGGNSGSAIIQDYTMLPEPSKTGASLAGAAGVIGIK
jgi:hypothetical protein